MEQIRYLKQKEKKNTRQMYETIFAEDSKEFVDYYYQWKIKDNQMVVLEDSKGYEVMMHLNPYTICISGRQAEVPYIVAVATRPDCRRQGKMQQVMERVLRDLQQQHCPFAFLLPANPAYYYGQGFVFSSEGEKKIEKEQGKEEEWNCIPLDGTNHRQMQQAVEVANAILAEEYDMYIHRDVAYYERLVQEVRSEQGEVLLIESEGKNIGILSYGKDEQAEIKEFLLSGQQMGNRQDICDRIFGKNGWKEEEMRMMFRITDLQAFSGMLKGKNEVWKISVKDEIVPENNGTWRIEWNSKGGSVTKVSEEDMENEAEVLQKLDISEVTEKIVKKMSIFIREWG